MPDEIVNAKIKKGMEEEEYVLKTPVQETNQPTTSASASAQANRDH
jgi:hypothetical protein